ncbi:MAG: hypothetical protein HY922_07525 [Elusimicrobia bacterium]|nr:hypothetical protein [Elusimicrobiota bacterium]
MRSAIRSKAAIAGAAIMLALAAGIAEARPPWTPALMIEKAAGGFRLPGMGLSLEETSKPEKASLSRFARFAGKFMGRGDVASLGAFRIRFKVILE